MKKLLFLAVLVAVGFTACKKEESASPKTSVQKSSYTSPSSSNLEEKKDMGSWD